MSSSRIKPVVPSRTQLKSSRASSPPPTTSACAPVTTIVESTTFPGTHLPAVATCQPPRSPFQSDTLARSWRALFPCRPLKMAAVRFTLLVAVLLSLMFLATPLNADAIGLSDCRKRVATCFGSHLYCKECARDCEVASWHTSGEFSVAAGWLSRRCKRVAKVLAARGEAGY